MLRENVGKEKDVKLIYGFYAHNLIAISFHFYATQLAREKNSGVETNSVVLTYY